MEFQATEYQRLSARPPSLQLVSRGQAQAAITDAQGWGGLTGTPEAHQILINSW